MIATNHFLAGAVIGAALAPEYAVPAALAAHIGMDMLPHYGPEHSSRDTSKFYAKLVLADTSAMVALAYVLAIFGQWQMFWIGWLSFSPDLVWVYLHFKRGGTFHLKSENWLVRFHQKIQFFEISWGLIFELAVTAILLLPFLEYLAL